MEAPSCWSSGPLLRHTENIPTSVEAAALDTWMSDQLISMHVICVY